MEGLKMLVLTRKPDQSIIIGTDIEITVLEVRGEQVRLGIKAPRSVAVHRKEVFDQIRGEAEPERSHTRGSVSTPDIDLVAPTPELVEH
jgi:carbon storage regulator